MSQRTAQRSDGGEQRERRRGDEPESEIEAGPACLGNQAEPEEVGARSIQEDVEQRACADKCRQSEKRAFRAAVLEALRLRGGQCGRQEQACARRARRHHQRQSQAGAEARRALREQALRQTPDEHQPESIDET